MGYKKLNWNLGSPYAMVTNSCIGYGLICNADKINHNLRRAHNGTDITVSMKMRLGYENSHEILEKCTFKNVALHLRLGQQ